MRLPGEKCESTEKLNRDMPYSLCALCLCVFVVKYNFNRIRYTTRTGERRLAESRDDFLAVFGHDALFLAAHQVDIKLRHAGRLQRL